MAKIDVWATGATTVNEDVVSENPQNSNAYLLLSALSEGISAQVEFLRTDRDEERRLAEMGIRVGSRLEILRRNPEGPLMVAIGDVRLALGLDTAGLIVVSAVEKTFPGLRDHRNRRGILLENMAVGETGRVVGFLKSSSEYRKKLLAMGVTPGTAFSIVRVAPFGDPVEIVVRGYLLTLRKDEAATLLVERAADLAKTA